MGQTSLDKTVLSKFYDDLNMIAMTGTNDRLCWLAETCKTLLVLLRILVTTIIST